MIARDVSYQPHFKTSERGRKKKNNNTKACRIKELPPRHVTRTSLAVIKGVRRRGEEGPGCQLPAREGTEANYPKQTV